MSASDLAIVAALVFAWGMLSARLERFDVTAPITFVLAGALLTHGPLAPLGFMPSHQLVKSLAEVTLVLVLFSDASRVGLRDLHADVGLYLRLLGVGLPLTIALGTLLALALFTGMNIWLALLIGAALAPTDAALGAGLMVNQAVPARIRRIINVESGLNDGIATPFVLVAVAGAAAAERAASTGPGKAVVELAVGLLIGVIVGGAGGFLVKAARRREWAEGGVQGSTHRRWAVEPFSQDRAPPCPGEPFAAGMSARVPRAAKRPLERVTGACTGIGVLAVWGVPDGDADADPGAFVSGAGQGGQASRRGPVQGGQGMSAGSGDVVHRPGSASEIHSGNRQGRPRPARCRRGHGPCWHTASR